MVVVLYCFAFKNTFGIDVSIESLRMSGFSPPTARATRARRHATRAMRLASMLAAVVAAGAAAVADTEAADLAAENSMLQLKLKRLEDELQQELKYAPVLMRSSRSLRAVRTCQAVRTRGAGQLSHQTAGKGVTGRGEGRDCRGRATSREPWHHRRYSYVVVKGYIADAENVWMETMEVDEAKHYCNANAKCKGFTFAGPDECAPPAAPSHRPDPAQP